MSAMHYRLNEDFVASDVVRWYDKASLGDTVVIALPSHPSVWLSRCSNEYVYWWTERLQRLDRFPAGCTTAACHVSDQMAGGALIRFFPHSTDFSGKVPPPP